MTVHHLLSRGPVPKHLREKFIGHMTAADDPDLSDAMWQDSMERAATDFLMDNDLVGDAFRAFRQWVELTGERSYFKS